MEPAQSDFYSDKNHSFDSNFGSKSPLPPSYADQPHKPFVESVHTPLTSNSPEPYYYTPDSYRSPAYYHSDFPDHRLDQNIDPYDSAYRYQRPVFPRNEGMYDYRPMERPPAMRPYYASSMQPSQPLYNPANYNYYPQERYMSYNYPPSTFSSSPFYSTGSMMPSANPYMDEFAYDGSPVEMDGGNVDLCDDDPAYTISINRINRGEEHRTVVLVRNIPNRYASPIPPNHLLVWERRMLLECWRIALAWTTFISCVFPLIPLRNVIWAMLLSVSPLPTLSLSFITMYALSWEGDEPRWMDRDGLLPIARSAARCALPRNKYFPSISSHF